MPEGDSYTRVASLLRPALVGEPLVRVDGVPAVRRWADRLQGSVVESVRTHGKHLLVDAAGSITIHVWLGMTGWWRITDRRGRSRVEGESQRGDTEAGAMRLLIETAGHVAVCYAAPLVEVDRRRVIEHGLRRLGPDVLGEELELDEYRQRVSLLAPSTMAADLLLDQRVLAGVGNEYKNEVLFLEGIHPETPLSALTPDQIDGLALRSRRLMLPNVERGGARVTTGIRGMDRWVHGRTGQACRRCRTAILSSPIGARHPRATFWCPTCQAPPTKQTG